MPKLFTITEESLREALHRDPDATHKSLGSLFGCSDKTIAKELRRHGLRTKRWDERKHQEASRGKMSDSRRGKFLGPENPNFGQKKRPWLEGDGHPLRVWHRLHPDFGEKQRGSANPIHKVRHLYENATYVSRITRGLQAHVDAKRGRTYEETYGAEKAVQYKEKLRLASPTRLAKFSRKETWPERTVEAILVDLGYRFTKQAPVGYYVVDFLLADFPLIVQADGDYWHANPAIYADESMSPVQRKRRRLDASCDSYLRNRGYGVVRLWESDLHRDPYACRRLIESAVEQQRG